MSSTQLPAGLTARRINAMVADQVEAVRLNEAAMLQREQILLGTDHVLHAGLYARTIAIPAGVEIVGALIRIPTLLIVSGDAMVCVGDTWRRARGYCVIAAEGQRKQHIQARQDTALTMVFATQARTVEQAEDEFTEEAARLWSRRPEAINTITITGG